MSSPSSQSEFYLSKPHQSDSDIEEEERYKRSKLYDKRSPYYNERSSHYEYWLEEQWNKYEAACVIQKYWRQAISDPKHKICRNRLIREHSGMI